MTTSTVSSIDSGERQKEVLQIAIVGCGPRGLQCLEAITRHLSPHQLGRVRLTVFEPSSYPGAGAVYDPTQSPVLRMNFATQQIDFWKLTSCDQTDRAASLIGWLRQRYPQHSQSHRYIPRAIVGEYLSECYERIALRLRAAESFELVAAAVEQIVPSSNRWQIRTDDRTSVHDVVVLTTGHEGLRPAVETGRGENVHFAYATASQAALSERNLPAGSRVLIRGFALTAIDATLTLTEGRGGRFLSDFRRGKELLPPYVSSGKEPSRIDIRSRSGRPALAKPSEFVEPISDTFWDRSREDLRRLLTKRGSLDFINDVWPAITKAAADLVSRSGRPTTSRQVDDWFRGWSRYKMDAASAKRAMLTSLAVSTGRRPKDVAFALGETWRRLYHPMVTLLSHGGLAEQHWASFDNVSREMERIAFGPPAESVARMLRLAREGIVSFGLTTGAHDDRNDHNQYDHVVDAIMAAPHQPASDGPIAGLIQNKHVQLHDPTGAIRVDGSGQASGPHSGLYVFGRATEGWVIGNDTLSRTLHQHIECWAQSVSKQLNSKPRNVSTNPPRPDRPINAIGQSGIPTDVSPVL